MRCTHCLSSTVGIRQIFELKSFVSCNLSDFIIECIVCEYGGRVEHEISFIDVFECLAICLFDRAFEVDNGLRTRDRNDKEFIWIITKDPAVEGNCGGHGS